MSEKQDFPIEKRVSLVLADFLSHSPWKEFNVSKELFSEIGRTFLEVCYRDLGLGPDKLDETELRQALFELLPMRLAIPVNEAVKVPGIIGSLLSYLGESSLNPNAWKFQSVLDQAEFDFPKLYKSHGAKAVVDTPSKPYTRPGSKVGRNDPCPCGSGKKYKKCCADLLE